MSGTPSAVVLGWVVPRPKGRWHQSIVVTTTHIWITPELNFSANEELVEAAAAGEETFNTYLKGAGWFVPPEFCRVSDVRGVAWNETTGRMKIAAGDSIIAASIPDRKAGTKIEPLLKRVIAARLSAAKNN